MKRVHVLRRPVPVDELEMLDDRYDFPAGSNHRADRARIRRFRQIKHQLI